MKKIENVQNIKLVLYLIGIGFVIASRFTSFIEYNFAMSFATFILVITFVMDAYRFYQEKKTWKCLFCILLSLLLMVLLVYLWIYKI